VKRSELIRQLEARGCVLLRHGARHDWYQNPKTQACNLFPGIAKSKIIWLATFYGNSKAEIYTTQD
jgi:hypothetical protein